MLAPIAIVPPSLDSDRDRPRDGAPPRVANRKIHGIAAMLRIAMHVQEVKGGRAAGTTQRGQRTAAVTPGDGGGVV